MTKKNVIISMAITSSVLGINAIEANASSTGIVNTSALNVRSGAGTNHSIIGKLYKGDKVEVLESSSGWYKIKLSNGKTGWSSSEYIDKTNGSNNNGSSSTNSKTGTVNTSALNVRSGASTGHSIIGKLYKGDKVNIISSSNGWYNVKLSNGKTGWCSSEYITISSSDNNNNDNNTETPSVVKKGTVNTSTLNVRSGASTNYSVIDKVHKGDKVDVLSSSNSWYKVKLSNGKMGWCSSEYITIGSSDNNDNNNDNNTETPEVVKKGTVNTSTLNVRSGAGTNYSVVDKVYKGDKLDVLSSSSSWYKVKLSNGKVGWCSSEYITIGSDSSNPEIPPTEDSSSNSDKVNAVIDLAKKQIGKPYVWGATGPDSFDCSGLTSYVYKQGANYNLPRTSTEQSKVGTTVSKSNLKPGDLIFSSTNGTGNVSHVGIYIGNNEMIHAPKPGQNVHIVKINTTYWNNVYLHAKRVL